MALIDHAWYINGGDGSTTGYWGITKWATATAYTVGQIRRQKTTPTVFNERLFICIVAGTSDGTTEPTWVLTRGAITAEASGTVQWQECTGQAGLNGDLTNTPLWSAFLSAAVTLGQVVQRASAGSLQICTVAGTAGGSEPSFSNTAGVTTADGSVTWTSLGAPGGYTLGAAPWARLHLSLVATWGQAGNDFYVNKVHTETQSGSTPVQASPGTITSPCRILCVDFSLGTSPPNAVTTGAAVSATSTRGHTFTGYVSRCDGVSFNAGSGSSVAAITLGSNASPGHGWQFYNGKFTFASTGACSLIIGSSATTDIQFRLYNWTIKFGATTQFISAVMGSLIWEGGSIDAAGSAPATLIKNSASSRYCDIEFRGIDLSLLGSGKVLVDSQLSYFRFRGEGCKLGSSVTLANGRTILSDQVDFVNCDNSLGQIKAHYGFGGSDITERTVTRSGGASDGSSPFSRKIVTDANALIQQPFSVAPFAIMLDTADAKTLTIFGTWGGGAVPNNDDIWAEVEYPGDASSPLSTFLQNGIATPMTAHAALSADGVSSWGGGVTPFKMALSLTPGRRGVAYVRMKVGAPSQTFYIDPALSLS